MWFDGRSLFLSVSLMEDVFFMESRVFTDKNQVSPKKLEMKVNEAPEQIGENQAS